MDQKQLLRGNAVFHLRTPRSQSIPEGGEGGQGWKLEAGTQAEPVEERYLLTWSPQLAQFAFLHNPKPQAQAWHHPPWVGYSHINY